MCGILVIGGGELYIENVYRVACGGFIHLRMDYNSVFDGDVIVKNCRMGREVERMVDARWISFYNGLPNHITRSLTVDGLVCESSALTLYNIGAATSDSLTDEVNRLYLPECVRVKNVVGADGVTPITPTLAAQAEAFEGVKYICE